MTNTAVPVLENAELRLRPPSVSDVAARVALARAFGAMGLHRIVLRVAEYNGRAFATFSRNGFVGKRRSHEAALVRVVWHDDRLKGSLIPEQQGTAA